MPRASKSNAAARMRSVMLDRCGARVVRRRRFRFRAWLRLRGGSWLRYRLVLSRTQARACWSVGVARFLVAASVGLAFV